MLEGIVTAFIGGVAAESGKVATKAVADSFRAQTTVEQTLSFTRHGARRTLRQGLNTSLQMISTQCAVASCTTAGSGT